MLTLFAKNNQTFPKVRDHVQNSCPGVRYPEIRKNPRPTKKHLKKHLSPSRQRALCPFFLQNSEAVQTLTPPMATAGFVGRLAVSLFEMNCKGLLRACMTCSGWQERAMMLKGPVDKGGASKN